MVTSRWKIRQSTKTSTATTHLPLPPGGSVIQPSRGGRDGKVSGCSSLWIPGAVGVEVCSVLSPIIARLGQQGALFTGADMPGAAESPNCFTASLSCVTCSLWTRISLQREIKGQLQGTLPLSTFEDNPTSTEQCTETHTQTKTLLCEVWAEKSLIAWLDQREPKREHKGEHEHAMQH